MLEFDSTVIRDSWNVAISDFWTMLLFFLLVIPFERFNSLLLIDQCSLLNRVHHIMLNKISFICSILYVSHIVFFLHMRDYSYYIILIRVKTPKSNRIILRRLVFFEIDFLLWLHKYFLLTFVVFTHNFLILSQLCFFNLQIWNEVLEHGPLRFQQLIAIEQET